jgi:hypothetical protein
MVFGRRLRLSTDGQSGNRTVLGEKKSQKRPARKGRSQVLVIGTSTGERLLAFSRALRRKLRRESIPGASTKSTLSRALGRQPA